MKMKKRLSEKKGGLFFLSPLHSRKNTVCYDTGKGERLR